MTLRLPSLVLYDAYYIMHLVIYLITINAIFFHPSNSDMNILIIFITLCNIYFRL